MAKKGKENKVVIFLLVLLIASAVFFISALYWTKAREKAKEHEVIEQLKREIVENPEKLKLKLLLEEAKKSVKTFEPKKTEASTKTNVPKSENIRRERVNIKELMPLLDYVKTDDFWNKTTLAQKFKIIEDLSKLTRAFFPALPQDIIELRVKESLLSEGAKHYGKGYAEYREFIKETTPQLIISAIENKMAIFSDAAGSRKFWEKYTAEEIESKVSDMVDEYKKAYLEIYGKKLSSSNRIKEVMIKFIILKGSKVAKDTKSFRTLARKYLPKLLEVENKKEKQ